MVSPNVSPGSGIFPERFVRHTLAPHPFEACTKTCSREKPESVIGDKVHPSRNSLNYLNSKKTFNTRVTWWNIRVSYKDQQNASRSPFLRRQE